MIMIIPPTENVAQDLRLRCYQGGSILLWNFFHGPKGSLPWTEIRASTTAVGSRQISAPPGNLLRSH
jgi:hypothetical protein